MAKKKSIATQTKMVIAVILISGLAVIGIIATSLLGQSTESRGRAAGCTPGTLSCNGNSPIYCNGGSWSILSTCNGQCRTVKEGKKIFTQCKHCAGGNCVY